MSKGGSSARETAQKVSLICPKCKWRTRRAPYVDCEQSLYGLCSRCPQDVVMVKVVRQYEVRQSEQAQRELKGEI